MASSNGDRKSAVQSYLDVDFTFMGLYMELLSDGCDLDAEPLHELPADVLVHLLDFLDPLPLHGDLVGGNASVEESVKLNVRRSAVKFRVSAAVDRRSRTH